jgi:hypothetical protein
MPGEAVVLTSGTGLLGRPEQTEDSIEIVSLLNPLLKIGSRVQIDNASINQASVWESRRGSACWPEHRGLERFAFKQDTPSAARRSGVPRPEADLNCFELG